VTNLSISKQDYIIVWCFLKSSPIKWTLYPTVVVCSCRDLLYFRLSCCFHMDMPYVFVLSACLDWRNNFCLKVCICSGFVWGSSSLVSVTCCSISRFFTKVYRRCPQVRLWSSICVWKTQNPEHKEHKSSTHIHKEKETLSYWAFILFIQLVGSSPSSSNTNLYRLKNLTYTKGHIKTVNSKHQNMLTAVTKSADSQGNTKEKKKNM